MQLIGYTMQLWFWKHFIFHSLCMWLILVAHASNGEPLGLKLIHKFSDEARALLQHRSGGKLEPWPSKGSMDFYRMLHNHDRGRHERKLSTNGEVTFSKGMETAQLADQFGWLYYTLVDVGTPNKTFLVALDTGSDLFWVPCQCKQCAPRSAPGYPNLVQFLNVYSPAESVTSKPVSCSNSLCDLSNSCVSGTDQCPYSIQYLSTNTSTSGTLVEDIMYFSSRDPSKAPLLQVSVIFGCGQVQTGIFLEGGAPDGLLGLGLSGISLPSFLARGGLVQDSFSMCFAPEFSGRIFFGDKGDLAQQTTPFVPFNNSYPLYAVGLEQIFVGIESIVLQSAMIFDTGTTFSYFLPEIYQAVTKAFDTQVQLQRIPAADISAPFEFCYATSASGELLVPDFSVTFSGGGNFSVLSPYILLADPKNKIVGFCLAILPSTAPIIGQNFMTGYNIVFDRQELKLGWVPSNCSKSVAGGEPLTSQGPSISPIPSSPAKSPSFFIAPSPFQPPTSSPPAPLVSRSPSGSPPAPPSASSHSSPLNFILAAFPVGLVLLHGF